MIHQTTAKNNVLIESKTLLDELSNDIKHLVSFSVTLWQNVLLKTYNLWLWLQSGDDQNEVCKLLTYEGFSIQNLTSDYLINCILYLSRQRQIIVDLKERLEQALVELHIRELNLAMTEEIEEEFTNFGGLVISTVRSLIDSVDNISNELEDICSSHELLASDGDWSRSRLANLLQKTFQIEQLEMMNPRHSVVVMSPSPEKFNIQLIDELDAVPVVVSAVKCHYEMLYQYDILSTLF